MENFPINCIVFNQFSDMTYRRRNAGVICHDGFLFVVGGDDGSSNLSNVEVIFTMIFTWTKEDDHFRIF